MENLKKCYSKEKNDFKEVQRSGNSRDAVEKAENEIKHFIILAWLDSFLQALQTKSNITIVKEEDIEEPQNNYEMDEEFLEDQIEDNKKKRQLVFTYLSLHQMTN